MPVPRWFQHAFALDPAGGVEPNERQREIVDHLVREVVRRRLTTPALIALEACAPLNFVSAQTLVFFQPIIGSFAGSVSYDEFAKFLEQRGSVEYIRDRIAALEYECVHREAELP